MIVYLGSACTTTVCTKGRLPKCSRLAAETNLAVFFSLVQSKLSCPFALLQI